MSDIHNLARFVRAQAGVYDGVLDELRRGRKTGHWIWFIFPQAAGLGASDLSRTYAIRSLDEARAYLEHDVLGVRLRECAQTVLDLQHVSAEDIFGGLDAIKFRSCMTLFAQVSAPEDVFTRALERFFHGRPDEQTLALLRARAGPAGPAIIS